MRICTGWESDKQEDRRKKTEGRRQKEEELDGTAFHRHAAAVLAVNRYDVETGMMGQFTEFGQRTVSAPNQHHFDRQGPGLAFGEDAS